jgi:hypothetical protein
MMTPSQLADLLLSPLTKRHMVFMMERMSGAMAYHRYNKLSAIPYSVADPGCFILDPDRNIFPSRILHKKRDER